MTVPDLNKNWYTSWALIETKITKFQFSVTSGCGVTRTRNCDLKVKIWSNWSLKSVVTCLFFHDDIEGLSNSLYVIEHNLMSQ